MTQTLTENTQQNNKKFNLNDIKPQAQKILNSVWTLAAISFLIVFAWAIDFAFLSIGILVFYELAVFMFCPENPKAFILPLISVSYMITSIYGVFHWVYYGICIGIFIATVTTYILLQKFKYKKTLTKGKMFWPFVLAGIGNCLGGIIGFFEPLTFFIVLVFCVLVYGIYWFFLNFLTEYKKYFAYCLIFLTLIITAQLFINYLRAEDLAYALSHKVITVGTGEINGAAMFMLAGLCSCFYLAQYSKRDYLYILLAIFFDIATYLTFSRMALFIAAIVSVVYFFIILAKSPNKKWLLIATLSVICVGVLGCIVFFDKIQSLFSYYLGLGFASNGRGRLWPWMIEQFKQNWAFGIGFITRDPSAVGNYSAMPDIGGGVALVNAHNFFLHFLTCTGIFGFILNMPFYIKKYILTFKNFNKFKLFALFNFMCLFVSSLFDPAPNNSIFTIIISLIFIAMVENDKKEEDFHPVVEENAAENVDKKEEKLLNNKQEKMPKTQKEKFKIKLKKKSKIKSLININ